MALLNNDHVILDCAVTARDEALDLAAQKAAELGVGADASTLAEALKAREAEGSTGMMGGFAIPHCKCAEVADPCIVVLRFAEPVEWETMDKAPVKVAVALFIPDGERGTEHLRILSKLAVMVSDANFCSSVFDAAEASQVVEAINAGLEQSGDFLSRGGVSGRARRVPCFLSGSSSARRLPMARFLLKPSIWPLNGGQLFG